MTAPVDLAVENPVLSLAVVGRCGTCRYWAEGAQGREGFGNCQAIGDESGHGGLPTAEPLVFANNADGTVSSWLETRAEFGCVLHEPQAET